MVSTVHNELLCKLTLAKLQCKLTLATAAIQKPRPSGHLGLDQAITTVYGACVNAKNLTPLKAR